MKDNTALKTQKGGFDMSYSNEFPNETQKSLFKPTETLESWYYVRFGVILFSCSEDYTTAVELLRHLDLTDPQGVMINTQKEF